MHLLVYYQEQYLHFCIEMCKYVCNVAQTLVGEKFLQLKCNIFANDQLKGNETFQIVSIPPKYVSFSLNQHFSLDKPFCCSFGS